TQLRQSLTHVLHIGAVVADEHDEQRAGGQVVAGDGLAGPDVREGERRRDHTELSLLGADGHEHSSCWRWTRRVYGAPGRSLAAHPTTSSTSTTIHGPKSWWT